MPGKLFEADVSFPDLSGRESADDKLKAVEDYLYLLLESLRWTLRNLSPENFNETEMEDWLDRVATRELYAEYGAVADLTVDELRTDYRRARRFLAGDTSALDWLWIRDEEIDFISSTVARSDPDDPMSEPLTEQLRRGDLAFWWTDERHTQMTSREDTGLPVTVYRYDDLLKGTIRFTELTLDGAVTKIPTFVFGAGTGDPDDPNVGKGFLRKGPDSFDLWYHGAADNGVFIGQYTDLVGLRKTTALDFSGWDGGSFSETVDGGRTASYSVTFDSGGRPVKIADASGHETAVIWE